METFVGDTVIISLDCKLDVSGYTTRRIYYKKPDGTTGCWDASLCPLDNECITYTTDELDLDVAGEWSVQAFVTGVGGTLHGKWARFTVYNTLLESCTTAPPTTPVVTTAGP